MPPPARIVTIPDDTTISFAGLFEETITALERKQKAHNEQLLPKTIAQSFKEQKQRTAVHDGRAIHQEFLDNLEWFDDNGFPRSMQQRAFHDNFIRASCKIFYGKEFPKVRESLKDEFDWDDIQEEILIACPRRFGKTFSTAMFAAVFILTVPDGKVCIYSTSKNTAMAVVTQVHDFLKKMPQYLKFTVIKNNETTIKISPRGRQGDVRSIMSYTSNESISIPHILRCFLHAFCICICILFLPCPNHIQERDGARFQARE